MGANAPEIAVRPDKTAVAPLHNAALEFKAAASAASFSS